jgi:hypothetical protein
MQTDNKIDRHFAATFHVKCAIMVFMILRQWKVGFIGNFMQYFSSWNLLVNLNLRKSEVCWEHHAGERGESC